jgi:hypothetical protein
LLLVYAASMLSLFFHPQQKKKKALFLSLSLGCSKNNKLSLSLRLVSSSKTEKEFFSSFSLSRGPYFMHLESFKISQISSLVIFWVSL